jgi:D-amino-acid dehydrogenase
MEGLGYRLPAEILTADELRDVEPALAPEICSGFVIDQHWHVKPDTLVAALAAAAREKGVVICENEGVRQLAIIGDGRRVRARATNIEVEADCAIIAAGAWSGSLARHLGVEARMEAGKGYSFLVSPKIVPRRCIILIDAHVGCTPFGTDMRIGGTMEFSGLDTRVVDERVQQIVNNVRSAFKVWPGDDVKEKWAGLRPITPDGLPVIDLLPKTRNVYIASGYSMQGMTVALPAAEALADMIEGGRRPEVLAPFRLDRFRGSIARILRSR